MWDPSQQHNAEKRRFLKTNPRDRWTFVTLHLMLILKSIEIEFVQCVISIFIDITMD